jgi:hypothetical protein
MPTDATQREVKEGFLPAGISIVSVLGQIKQAQFINLPDGAGLEILPDNSN